MAGVPTLNIHLPSLRAAALPAMALGGLIGVVSVLVGLQCGGLDKCFAGPAAITNAAVEVADAAGEPVAPEPRLTPDAPIVAAAVAPTTEAAPVSTVAMKKPAAAPEAERARRADDMIGDTFAAIASDDTGWLNGAHSAPVPEETQVAEAPADKPAQAGQKPVQVAARTVEAVAKPLTNTAASLAAEAAVTPLERPEPLQVAAFAEEPVATEPKVKKAAEQKLAAVTKSEPQAAEPEVATALAVEPAPVAESKPEATKKAVASSGATRTVAGAGVNVRSGPGKSSGKLFALAGGEKVKVGENQKGWLKITDDRGRTGWVYKTFLN